MENGKLLREINSTTLTLVPKVAHPTLVIEFRPIAVAMSFISAGFMEGRQILQNISIVQDLVSKYGRKDAPKGCLLKVDIRKAYDSVKWDFLLEMLSALNFPAGFIQLIMACVTSLLTRCALMDDLIIFSKGDKNSVNFILRSLATFASSSGLVANEGKSNIYFCNVSEEDREDIIITSGFMEGKLPFRYLGVNVSSRKLSKGDCQCLIDKITGRIRN
ncbi:uncharacterized protein LOC110706196 [Chenopodium quinoa]|uniref:uncharacterized protein LOC110706196 n=1 Tax=Chenopodium quinoa TaxID=63459 RepID=UPI000B78574E|nr:uncharacterized protein LOC110706196 [Chenopodium quinoa]